MSVFEVRRDDLRTTRVVDDPTSSEDLGAGEARLRIERFGMTANNVTYAAMGDAMRYWSFFPASEDGWGRVPVWGFGEVEASEADGVGVGERFYGYFPMAGSLTVQPRVEGPGFTDAAEHRAPLPGLYNRYVATPDDAAHPDETLLLRPLFGTSFLLDDLVRSTDAWGAQTLVLSSASSKTAYGLAFILTSGEDGDRPVVVGLTSPGNAGFVEGLGLYDRVVTYDALADELGATDEPVAYVDMSGDATVRGAVHRAVEGRLRHSLAVGATHWDQLSADAGELPGPAPALFFAPTHLEEMTERLGGAEVQRRMAEAWDAFIGRVAGGMEVDHGAGPDDVARAWLAQVEGTADPGRGQVLRLP
jgi:hypothetical protein